MPALSLNSRLSNIRSGLKIIAFNKVDPEEVALSKNIADIYKLFFQ